MGKKLNFDSLHDLFEKGNGFELTDAQYEEKVGKPLPKNASYIKSKSPLAKTAREHGYVIQVTEKPIIQRTLVFEKISK